MTNTNHNNSGAQGHAPETGSFSYDEFHSLPRELRDFLNELEFIHSTDVIVEVLRSGEMTVEEIKQRIREGVQQKIANDLVEVWGIK